MSESEINALANVRVVMIHTTHPGNIGAAARAMKTMGLVHLWLVAPKSFPHADATARATEATDVLDNAHVVATLEAAVADCGLVLGASARARTIAWPKFDARSAGRHALVTAQHAKVAMVFGSERDGLTNAEIDRCHSLVQIPTHSECSSLNIAAAVQVLAYELRMAMLENAAASIPPSSRHIPAAAQDVERFYLHLQHTLADLKFLDPKNPRLLMRRVRRLFNRALPDTMELNILRGVLTAVNAKCNEHK